MKWITASVTPSGCVSNQKVPLVEGILQISAKFRATFYESGVFGNYVMKSPVTCSCAKKLFANFGYVSLS